MMMQAQVYVAPDQIPVLKFWQLNFDSKSEWLFAIDELTTILDHG